MVNLNAKGFNLAEKTMVAAEKELKKIKKMLPKSASFDITISKKVNDYCCNIMVKDAGNFIKSEAVADSADLAVNFAIDYLKHKVRNLKKLLVAKKRKQLNSNSLNSAKAFLKNAALTYSSGDEECDGSIKKIVKTNKILLQMMDEEEAIAQMETLGRNHFIYIGEDGVIRLIYRLEKYGYGLLICEC